MNGVTLFLHVDVMNEKKTSTWTTYMSLRKNTNSIRIKKIMYLMHMM